VVGFSLGGGAAIVHASTQPDLISVVVAYYPGTRFIPDKEALIDRWKVPTVVFAGDADHYDNNCCVIETIRKMEAYAKDRGAPFELVVYPRVQHGFITGNPAAIADSGQRTLVALNQHLGLKRPAPQKCAMTKRRATDLSDRPSGWRRPVHVPPTRP
jgi:dienelactone hydrolase